MWIFFTVLCIIIILLAFIVIHKWRITLLYKDGVLSVRADKIKIYSSKKGKKDKGYIKMPKISFGEAADKIKAFKAFYNDEKHEIVHILKEIEKRHGLCSIGISVTYGFSDAAATGIANGIIWTALTGLVSLIDRYVKIKEKTSLAVCPLYTESCFDAGFTLVFEMRIFKTLYVLKRANMLHKKWEQSNGGRAA